MKTVDDILDEKGSKWKEDEFGIVMFVSHGYEVRLESRLYGGHMLAVYRDTELIGEKLPVTLGTPSQNGLQVADNDPEYQ